VSGRQEKRRKGERERDGRTQKTSQGESSIGGIYQKKKKKYGRALLTENAMRKEGTASHKVCGKRSERASQSGTGREE